MDKHGKLALTAVACGAIFGLLLGVTVNTTMNPAAQDWRLRYPAPAGPLFGKIVNEFAKAEAEKKARKKAQPPLLAEIEDLRRATALARDIAMAQASQPVLASQTPRIPYAPLDLASYQVEKPAALPGGARPDPAAKRYAETVMAMAAPVGEGGEAATGTTAE
jgi:hypothetical protein